MSSEKPAEISVPGTISVVSVIVLVFLWASGLLPFGADEEPDKPDPDVVVVDDVAKQAIQNELKSLEGKVKNLREIARKLDGKDFDSVKDGVTDLKALNNKSQTGAWSPFADSMQSSDKADDLKAAASYMRKSADGLEQLIKDAGGK